MRTLIIILSLISLSCKNSWQEGFEKINPELDTEKLVTMINPHKKYSFWEYRKGWKNTLIREEGDTLLRNKYEIEIPQKGFFWDCPPLGCVSYIAYVDSGRVNYVTSEKELRMFIGKIDNLEEALLVAKTHGLWFDTENLEGGSFKKTDIGYKLYLMKYDPCPVTKESLKVSIDSLGNFKVEKNGIYFKSTDCLLSKFINPNEKTIARPVEVVQM